MTWHPLTLAIWLTEMTAWAIYLGAVWRLMVILPRWDPMQNNAGQLWRERALELVAFQGRWAMALQSIVLVLILAGISNAWVPVVPGAMCGIGVLQAMGPAGQQALALKAATWLILYCWWVVERLSRGRPDSLPAIFPARLLLLAAPVMALAAVRLGQAVTHVTPFQPVSCCAVLYDQVKAAGQQGIIGAPLFMESTWLLLALGGTVLLAVWGVVIHHRCAFPSKAMMISMSVFIPLWGIVVYKALMLSIAPYIYQVLFHPCPWCLFLADHGAVGFALFGLPAWVAAESAAGLSVWMVARRYPQSSAQALKRLQRAGLRIRLGATLLLLLAAWPVLSWRINFGGWMR